MGGLSFLESVELGESFFGSRRWDLQRIPESEKIVASMIGDVKKSG
jgi:hypothetical protein